MALALLEPPNPLQPAQAQAIVAAAPQFLKTQKGALPYPISLFISNESQEKWISYENILIASLQTGDFPLAKDCVDALAERFGKLNERVIILQGLYDEASAADDNALRSVLKRYDGIIQESPTMFGVHKRRIALLKSLGRTQDAVTSLVALLDASPVDAEAWMELADLYEAQGSLEQATFCLEEVLIVTPNAWNVQAKLGELLFLSAKDNASVVGESIKRFCRSAELSEDYLRAYYGLHKATTKLLALSSSESPISKASAQKLQVLATTKLAEILRRAKGHEKGWDGYDPAELSAAQALLDQSQTTVAR